MRAAIIFFTLFFIIFIDWMSIGLTYPLFSSIIYQPDISLFSEGVSEVSRGIWLGCLLGACPLAQFFSGPILGILSDRKGRGMILKIALFITTCGYFFSMLGTKIKNPLCILIGQLIVGIGTGNASVVNASIADLSTDVSKARNFSFISLANGLGFALGPMIGGKLMLLGRTETPFLFAGILSLGSFILLFFFFRETYFVKKEEKISPTQIIKKLFAVKRLFQLPPLRALLFCFFTFCIGWSFYWEFISTIWIKKYHLDASSIGNLYSYGALWFALNSGLLIQPLLQRFKSLRFLFFISLALGFSILPLLWFPPIEFFWGCIPLQQFFLALLFPIGMSLLSNMVKKEEQGELMGIIQSLESLAFATTPLLAGCFISLHESMPILVGSMTMILAATILLFSYLSSSRQASA